MGAVFLFFGTDRREALTQKSNLPQAREGCCCRIDRSYSL